MMETEEVMNGEDFLVSEVLDERIKAWEWTATQGLTSHCNKPCRRSDGWFIRVYYTDAEGVIRDTGPMEGFDSPTNAVVAAFCKAMGSSGSEPAPLLCP